MCFNKKVIGALLVVGVAVFLLAPSAFSAALPLLLVAACPLSMLVMMRSMNAMGGTGGDESRSRCGSDGGTKTTDGEDATAIPHAARRSIAMQAEIDQLKAEKATLEAQLSHDGGARPHSS